MILVYAGKYNEYKALMKTLGLTPCTPIYQFVDGLRKIQAVRFGTPYILSQ